MRIARTTTVALTGIEGHLVTVEAGITNGLPATILTGLPDTALREARDRVRAAIVNSGETWPSAKITVGLSPARLPKRGSAFDLAIGIAVMAANDAVPEVPENLLFLAELGLDGRLWPTPGVLPAVLAAAEAGVADTVVVAKGNHGEASLVDGVTVVAADTLREVVHWLRGGDAPPPGTAERGDGGLPARPLPDLADMAGQAQARLAVEVSAAGGHHLSMVGPPQSGMLMLAERLPTIMPPLDPEEALEVTAIRSVAAADSGKGMIEVPPLSAPHHTCSMAFMMGGGSGLIRPGAVSLAHRGVLLLEQAPEFHGDVLDALREPLDTGLVVLTRASSKAVFPARFTLVLTADPCPCAKARTLGKNGCACSAAARRRYLGRLSGPLLDRIDLKVQMQPASQGDLIRLRGSAESSATVAERVTAARERAVARLAGTPWRVNAEAPGTMLRRSYPPTPEAIPLLDRMVELGQFSARGADKIIRVAWTLADLAGKDQPGTDQVHAAIGLRLGVTG